MTDFNDIGISRQLDWKRIKKLLAIGFCERRRNVKLAYLEKHLE